MNWNRDGRKKELWEKEKNPLQVFMINLKIAIRKFNRETRGLGLIFLILIAVIVIIDLIVPLYRDVLKTDAEKQQELELQRKNWCFTNGGCTSGI